MYYLICVLLLIIAILVVFILEQNKKYDADILSKNKQITIITGQYNYYKEECKNLKEVIEVNSSIFDYLIPEPKIELEQEPIYKGKKALIGDYLVYSYTITKSVLETLGFKVSIALSSDELVQKIKNNEKYDIIFTNNIYRDGTGEKCLSILKSIKDFNTPIVIHTITKNAKYHFENELGFDAYIEKPVTQTKLLPILEKLLRTGGEKCCQRHLKLFIY